MKVLMGHRELEVGSKYITLLRNSNDILGNIEALQQRMKEEGYLLIRGFHERDQVMKARKEFVEQLKQKGRLSPGTPVEEAIIGPGNKGMNAARLRF